MTHTESTPSAVGQVVPYAGQHWLIEAARSMTDAMDAIAIAAVRGSTGSRTIENGVLIASVSRVGGAA